MTKTKSCGERNRTIKVKAIKDPNTNVAINEGWHRIEEIKNEIAVINCKRQLCEVPVVEMWEDLPEGQQ